MASPQHEELIPHLFRTEYRKIISVLVKHFGFPHIETAEDIASETFLTAATTWGLSGTPANPTAWLYTVANNKAKNYASRKQNFDRKISVNLNTGASSEPGELDLSPQNMNDSQLQMMFAICDPSIASESQVGMALRFLCGFGIEEIASAFLSNKETIQKRLMRAKETLREEKIRLELPDASLMTERLSSVLQTIYLLFNEGYYSVSNDKTIRRELCFEAMRLCTMLVENSSTNTPTTNALLSLMCFHASRFDARVRDDGELILYNDQDPTLWNGDLISKGGYFLNCATQGNTLSQYHLEAGIAYWNTRQVDTIEKWENILGLYNRLLMIHYSPIAALNRTYALSKVKGNKEAIIAAERLALTGNQFYFALLGTLYSDIDVNQAKLNFEKALGLAKTVNDKQAIQKKIASLK